MSANINYNQKTKEHSFVSAKELPWHKLGKVVANAMTSTEAIDLAGLNYTVNKNKVYVKFPDNIKAEHNIRGKIVPDSFATYRTDTLDVFGTVGSRYEVVQNHEAFKFMDSIVGKDKAIYETAGALGKGETVFVTAKLPEYIIINGNDVIENYLVVSLNHNGKFSINIFLTPVRVVCQNTLSVGLQAAKLKFSIRHTANAHDKMNDARRILDISSKITFETQELYQHLVRTKITDEVVEQYFNNIFLTKGELASLVKSGVKYDKSTSISTRKKNIITDVHKFYEIGIGQSNIIGTKFGAYQAITGYLSNVKDYKSTDVKMSNLILGGSDAQINQNALELISVI
jgi:phage/plasmid-like protein (TIGR03299 family)